MVSSLIPHSRTGAPWAASLAERAGLLCELSVVVTPEAGEPAITCHRDLHPDNLLVDGSGELARLDSPAA